MTIEHFSYTTFSIPCPRALIKKARGDKIEVPPTEESERGVYFHQLFSNYLKNPKAYKEEMLNPIYDKFYQRPEIAKQNIANLDWLKKQGDWESEKEISYEIDGKKIEGRIDLVINTTSWMDEEYQEVWIIDFKTAYQTKKTPEHVLQGYVYALPYLKQGYHVKFYIYYIRHAIPTKHNWKPILELSPDKADEIEERLKAEIKRVEDTIRNIPDDKTLDEMVNISWYCNYCPFAISCPKVKEMVITSEDEALKAGEQLVKLKNAVSLLESKLKGWVKKNGNLKVAGKLIGYRDIESRKYNPVEVAEFLRTKDPELYSKVIRIDGKQIDSIAYKHEEVANMVEIVYYPKWGVVNAQED